MKSVVLIAILKVFIYFILKWKMHSHNLKVKIHTAEESFQSIPSQPVHIPRENPYYQFPMYPFKAIFLYSSNITLHHHLKHKQQYNLCTVLHLDSFPLTIYQRDYSKSGHKELPCSFFKAAYLILWMYSNLLDQFSIA